MSHLRKQKGKVYKKCMWLCCKVRYLTLALLIVQSGAILAEPVGYHLDPDSWLLTLVDTRDGTSVRIPKGVLDAAGLKYPVGITLTPDKTTAYVVNYYGRINPLIAIDLKTDATTPISIGATNGLAIPRNIAFSTDGNKVYIEDFRHDEIAVLDAHELTFLESLSKDDLEAAGIWSSMSAAMTPNGKEVYIANIDSHTVTVVNTENNTATTIDTGNLTGANTPNGVAITPDGSRVFVTNMLSNDVTVIQTADHSLTTIDIAHMVGAHGPRGIAITPDGDEVYIANFHSGNVTIINTDDYSVTPLDNLSYSLESIGITPDGKQAYITQTYSDNILVIDTFTKSVNVISKHLVGSDTHVTT